MNPNMFGQMPMGQLPKVPTTTEMWKDEKTKYRHWIILFGVSILAIFGLLLAGLIVNLVNEHEIKDSLIKWAEKGNINMPSNITAPTEVATYISDWASKYWRSSLIIVQSIKLALVFIGVILFISTVYTAYTKKSFSHISKWATTIVGLGALVGVWQLLSLIWGASPVFSYPQGIYDFILYILPIAVYIFVSQPINKIRRQFAYSERIEQIKNSPQYKQMMEQMEAMQNGQAGSNPMGPFGPMSQPQPTNPMAAAPMAAAPAQPVKKELTPSEKRAKELSNMKVEELKAIAKKLSISGYSAMKKEELIENIIRITEND